MEEEATQAPVPTEILFERDLTQLINAYSLENRANCPDYILASYLRRCYENFCDTNFENMSWHSWKSITDNIAIE